MEQKANITIDNHHITVERMQTACGREIRVISVFPRHGSETAAEAPSTNTAIGGSPAHRCGGSARCACPSAALFA